MNNKAVEILSTFSKTELIGFNKFLKSPYFNNNSKVTSYYLILLEQISSQGPHNSDHIIFNKIYPGEKYRDDRMRKLSSELNKLAQRFISQKRFDEEALLRKRFLLEEYSARKLDNLFTLKIEKVKKFGAEQAKQDFRYLHEMFLLENMEIMFHFERNNQSKTIPLAHKRGEYLITYFLMMLFKSIDDVESNVSVYNADYEDTLLNEFDKSLNSARIIEFIRRSGTLHTGSLLLYYSFFRAWKDFDNDKLYFEAKALLEENFNTLNAGDKENILMIMMNYCIKKFYYTHDDRFNREKFFIYKLYLQHRLYKNSKTLGRTMFMNILKLATMIHEFKWAKEFVNNYADEFITAETDTTKHFSYAIIAFHEQNYQAALSESSKVIANINEMGDKIGLKTYIICSHYELGNFDAAYEELKNFKVFLKKNNISGYFKNPAVNYTKALTKLLSYNLSPGKKNKNVKYLEKYIVELETVNFQGWLLKKVRELS